MDGLATLARLRERQVDAQIVLISGHGNIESAVRAIKLGAFDFVEKPLSLEKTVLVVRNESLYGLVTDRDLVVRAVAEARGADEPVGPLSSGNLIGVDADANVREAMRLMREHAVRRLPVLENGQVAGIVSLGDLAMQDEPVLSFAQLSAIAVGV